MEVHVLVCESMTISPSLVSEFLMIFMKLKYSQAPFYGSWLCMNYFFLCMKFYSRPSFLSKKP